VLKDLLILGIDPGSVATGYGIVARRGNRLIFIGAGVVRSTKEIGLPLRLDRIYQGISQVIHDHRPVVAAVEQVFHSTNPRSSLVLGHARGAAILAAVHSGLEVYEYTPMQVKQAVVGYGKAEKSQVQQMVKMILGLKRTLAQDASDALAVAICHANTCKFGDLVR